jgi:hypothetical protein
MAWAGIGLCGLVSLVQFLPGSSYLQIRYEGFEFRALWRGATFRWSEDLAALLNRKKVEFGGRS